MWLCSVRALAIAEATIQAYIMASTDTKQKPAIAPRSARMPRIKRASTNKKSEYASAKSQKHNGGDEGHALPHDEMARKKG
jgi:hypothetical protein